MRAAPAVVLALTFSVREASADAARCGLGLVLDVPEATANDIASAVCASARTQKVSGTLRIGVVRTSSLAVTIARVGPSGAEEVLRFDARDTNDAVARAPHVLATWSDEPAPPSTDAEASSSPAVTPPVDAPIAEPAPKPPTKESISKPRLRPGFIVGVHGAVATSKIASSAAPGGGVMLGLGDEHVHGVVDFTYAQNEQNNLSSFRHMLLTGGARLVVSDSILRPAFGGGWSISHVEAGRENGRRDGGGLGLYGEAGVFVVPSKRHHIGTLARMNLPLYDAGRHDYAPAQFAFLLAYVHTLK